MTDTQILQLVRAGMSNTDAAAFLLTLPQGGVGAAALVANQAALTAAASVGVPTKVEFDKVVADAVAARTTLNALLASLRAAGVLAT